MEQELKPLPEIGDPTSFTVRKCKKNLLLELAFRPEENVFEKLWSYVEQSSAERKRHIATCLVS